MGRLSREVIAMLHAAGFDIRTRSGRLELSAALRVFGARAEEDEAAGRRTGCAEGCDVAVTGYHARRGGRVLCRTDG